MAKHKVISNSKGTPLMEKGYDEVFKSLSKEKQTELIERNANFARTAEIYL